MYFVREKGHYVDYGGIEETYQTENVLIPINHLIVIIIYFIDRLLSWVITLCCQRPLGF